MIPLWLKVAFTAFVLVLIPFYWRSHGPTNFLWFSDIALVTTMIALWTESRLLASMMALAVLLPELVWNVAFFGRLLTGHPFGGLTGYMFDPEQSFFLRGLSLFHIFVPIVLVWMVWRLGYDNRALIAITIVAWIILPISYFVSERSENINWVFGIGEPQTRLHPLAYLALLMVLFPLLLYLPTHFLLKGISR